MPATSTYVATPNTEEIENAWFDLMQGELGLDHDWRTRELAQTMVDYMRQSTVFDEENPTHVVSSHEAARRIAAAFSAILYGE